MNAPEQETPDKQQIEAEEKEAMLGEEGGGGEAPPAEGLVRTALAGAVSDEGREVKPKYIPIGGIKMPGFFTRSSDKNKEEEPVEPEGEKEKCEEVGGTRKRRRLLFTCPFTQFLHHPENQHADTTGNTDDQPPSAKKRILDGIRKPLVNMFQKPETKDPEAVLASMETLGDKLDAPNDGMETVKLDGSDEPEGQVATKLPLRERIKQKKFIKDDLIVFGVALVVVLVVVVVSVLVAGIGPPAERPLREGIFVTTITSCGHVEGVLKNGAYNFYGIPYAVPPIGEKRFTYAQPLNNISTCWNGTLNVQNPAPFCLQILENGNITGQEDCLTLDVVTPHVRYDSPLPVVVLIGANSLAGGISPLQPSSRYARSREVVFVRPNFRLGALGFLSLSVLAETKYPKTSGNYGLSDLIVALDWIQNNIKHFGGDPTSVTLLGHRAGATLAYIITTIKKPKNLYTRAWLTSGSVVFPKEENPDKEVQKEDTRFLDMSKCKSAECLRRLNTTQILQATPDVWLTNNQGGLPVVEETRHSWLFFDGDLIRKHPIADRQASGNADKGKDKKIVLGSTEHSASTELLRKLHVNWTADIIDEMVSKSALANISVEVFKYFNKTYEGVVGLISAVRSVCPLVELARKLELPLYVVSAAGAGAGGNPRVATVDADVQAILGTFESNTPEQRRFVAAMQHHFYYFVANGQLPAPTVPLIHMAQDALPLDGLPVCDVLIQHKIVPQFARVD